MAFCSDYRLRQRDHSPTNIILSLALLHKSSPCRKKPCRERQGSRMAPLMQQSLSNLHSSQNWQLEMAKHLVHFPPTLPLYPLSRPCEQGRQGRNLLRGGFRRA